MKEGTKARRKKILALSMVTIAFTLMWPALVQPAYAGLKWKITIKQSAGVNARWVGDLTDPSGTIIAGTHFDIECKGGAAGGSASTTVDSGWTVVGDVKYDLYTDWNGDNDYDDANEKHLGQHDVIKGVGWKKRWTQTPEPPPSDEWVLIRIDGPVGGIALPVDKLALFAPYITLAIAAIAVALGVVSARKRWLGKAVLPKPY